MNDKHRNLRKAAVLVASLDDERAGAILAQMSPEQARAVRSALEQLGPLDPAEQREVIEEFFRIGPLVPDAEPSGIELNHLRPENTCRPQTEGVDGQKQNSDQPAAQSSLWHETSVEALASFLEQEQPQTIAVIISRLASQRAAEVLAVLPAEMQIEVARRVVDLDETDPAVLSEIEHGLLAWLDERAQAENRRTAGMTALAGILEAANPHTRAHILENLGHSNTAKEECDPEAPQPVIQFVDLVRWDSTSLQAVLNRAESQLLILALAGARPEFAERALGLVSPAKANALRRAHCRLGPTRLSDIEAAQQELAHLAHQLELNGEIVRKASRHLSVAV